MAAGVEAQVTDLTEPRANVFLFAARKAASVHINHAGATRAGLQQIGIQCQTLIVWSSKLDILSQFKIGSRCPHTQ